MTWGPPPFVLRSSPTFSGPRFSRGPADQSRYGPSGLRWSVSFRRTTFLSSFLSKFQGCFAGFRRKVLQVPFCHTREILRVTFPPHLPRGRKSFSPLRGATVGGGLRLKGVGRPGEEVGSPTRPDSQRGGDGAGEEVRTGGRPCLSSHNGIVPVT